MKKFLFQILSFIFLMLPLAYGLDYIISAGLRQTQYGNFAEMNDIFQGRVSSDLVILGTSRAGYHISPSIIDSTLKVSTYNINLNAEGFSNLRILFEAYEKYNSVPKYLILSVDFFTFAPNSFTRSVTDSLPSIWDPYRFLPYFSDPYVKKILSRSTGFSIFEIYLPLIRYQKESELISVGIESFFGLKHYKRQRLRGYETLDCYWDVRMEKTNNKKRSLIVYENIVNDFNDFLYCCKKEKINVVIVYTPEYHLWKRYLTGRDELFEILNNASKHFDIPFLDYSSGDISKKQYLFYDAQHLNKKGSEIFSQKLSNDLMKIWNLEI